LLLLFFLRQLPPPSSPFPYTTLFRSAGAARGPRKSRREPRTFRLVADSPSAVSFLHRTTMVQYRMRSGSRRSPGRISRERERKRDRKSTRLNSSHVKISYAVFCLKKK